MTKKKADKLATALELEEEEDKEQGSSKEEVISRIEGSLIVGGGPTFKDLNEFRRFAESIPELTAEREREEAEASLKIISKEGPKAPNKHAEKLLFATLRVVASLAYKYRGYGLPEKDLMQVGMIGLMEAIKRYDPDKKGKSNKTKDGKKKPKETARLATYASYRITGEIYKHVLQFYSAYGKIATTADQRKLFFKLEETKRLLGADTKAAGQSLGIEDADKIAEKLSVKRADVLEMEKRRQSPVPYEMPGDAREDEIDTSASARLAADDGEHAEMSIIRENMKNRQVQMLGEAIKTLDERQAMIIFARHLANEGEKKTLKELAGKLEVSIERVRQIEKEALRKLKDYVLEHADPEDFDE
ncbi:MAG: sigma-70 family RNA polymerase sigma factor [Betaproteobacteria bacterium AqS2]|uniref:RNA polymerase sigma factor n=1 Tax=Candidatus Amphirhobacter heronislandensis TaxID=1732024 RepID=A0A930UGU3_9GAMM|nr:sigma-70 family RNA polymerase sigma factor [Betaproteobacteria bacterium AqS2]